MSQDQIKQIHKLKEIWHYRATNIVKPSGPPYENFVLLLMVILNNSKTIAEYGAHTGQMSALLGPLTDVVDGKFTGIDNWEFFNASEEKSKSIICNILNFVDVKNYEIVTADCNNPIYVNADFHFWDIFQSDTPAKLVSSIHEIINHANNKPFMICIDDCVKDHPYGNKEFIEEWKNKFPKLSDMHIALVTGNKLFLTNYTPDNKLNQLIELIQKENILPHSSNDKFYNQQKYIGNLFDETHFNLQVLTNDSFWNRLLEIFEN